MQQIQQIKTFGGIVATANENNTTVTNCYYLNGTCDGGINGKDTDGAVKKEAQDMITEEFVNTLNEGNKETVWIKDKNNGYPILN